MAASTRETGSQGTEVNWGDHVSVIALSETNQLATGHAKLGLVSVWAVGTTWAIDVYDNATTEANKIWGWVTADGKGPFQLQIPCQLGLRVVTTGATPGSVTIVWS